MAKSVLKLLSPRTVTVFFTLTLGVGIIPGQDKKDHGNRREHAADGAKHFEPFQQVKSPKGKRISKIRGYNAK
jgi:hypothetical protein